MEGGRTVDFRVLRYFVAAADAGGITHAAERLHVTQPTVSRQLQELEEELGQALFVRESRGMRLTPAGRLFYRRAADILEMARRTKSEFAALSDFSGGDTEAVCAETAGIRLLARVFRDVRRRFPEMRLGIRSGNIELALDRLRDGLADFAVIMEEADLADYESAELPHRDLWGLLVREDDLLAQKKAASLADCLGRDLFLSRRGLQPGMSPAFDRLRNRLRIAGTYDLAYNAAQLVREGAGAAVTIGGIVTEGRGTGLCFRPFAPAFPAAPLRLIWPKAREPSRAAAVMIDALKKAAAEESGAAEAAAQTP
jgi:DNA-binding transcriptional LysR family regulator